MKFDFRPHDKNAFPKFNPKLSPSQKFQFTYNAYCSYFKTTYYHEVTQYFHSLAIGSNCIVDIKELPMQILETSLRDSLDLRPVFFSCMHYKYIFAFICSNVPRPDLFVNSVPMINKNNNIRLIDFSNCRVETGILELANSIVKNPGNNIVYWDLSNNPIGNFTPFSIALKYTKAKIFYLNVSNVKMSPEAISTLMLSLYENPNLYAIKSLYVDDSEFIAQTISNFVQFLEGAKRSGRLSLRTFSISNIGKGINQIIEVIHRYEIPLESLNISNNKITEKCLSFLLNFLSKSHRIKELNISNINLKPKNIVDIIDEIINNRSINSMSLNLSNLGLSKKSLILVLDALKKANDKWSFLYFDDNGLTTSDLATIIDYCKPMQKLKGLSVGGNFDSKSKRLPNVLPKILDITSLKTVLLKGGAKKLQTSIIPFLEKLKTCENIEVLDISCNKIKDKGIKCLIEVINSENCHIKKLDADDSSPSNEVLIEFLDAICNSDSLYSYKFPINDVYHILGSKSQKEEKSLFDIFSSKQRLIQQKTSSNRLKSGIRFPYYLVEKNIPELNKLLNDINAEIRNRFERVKVNEHDNIASDFGLQMPFLNDDNETIHDSQYNNLYELGDSNVAVNANEGIDMQYNSLAITSQTRQNIQSSLNHITETQGNNQQNTISQDNNSDNNLHETNLQESNEQDTPVFHPQESNEQDTPVFHPQESNEQDTPVFHPQESDEHSPPVFHPQESDEHSPPIFHPQESDEHSPPVFHPQESDEHSPPVFHPQESDSNDLSSSDKSKSDSNDQFSSDKNTSDSNDKSSSYKIKSDSNDKSSSYKIKSDSNDQFSSDKNTSDSDEQSSSYKSKSDSKDFEPPPFMPNVEGPVPGIPEPPVFKQDNSDSQSYSL